MSPASCRGRTWGRARPPRCGSPERGCRWGPAASRAHVRRGMQVLPGGLRRGDRYLGAAAPPQARLAAQGQFQVGGHPALVQEALQVTRHQPALRPVGQRRRGGSGVSGGACGSWGPRCQPRGSSRGRLGQPGGSGLARLREPSLGGRGERDAPRRRWEKETQGQLLRTLARTPAQTRVGSYLIRGRRPRRELRARGHGGRRIPGLERGWARLFITLRPGLAAGPPRGGAGASAGPPQPSPELPSAPARPTLTHAPGGRSRTEGAGG